MQDPDKKCCMMMKGKIESLVCQLFGSLPFQEVQTNCRKELRFTALLAIGTGFKNTEL